MVMDNKYRYEIWNFMRFVIFFSLKMFGYLELLEDWKKSFLKILILLYII